MRPLLLDLFCGAGGAGMGYYRAGFDVIGVDVNPQPNYPFRFIQDDAVRWAQSLAWRANGGRSGMPGHISSLIGNDERRIRAVHASPPCQRYSAMSACRPGLSDSYPDLVDQIRWRLKLSDLPYVIENVPGSPLLNPVMLCGHMFDLPLYRHRLFESNIHLWQPEHPKHVIPASRAGHWTPGTIMSISGHVSPIAEAKRAMGIDWMPRNELAESIPPAYTEHIGAQLFAAIEVVA